MENFIWVEKYRPKTLNDMIMSFENRKIFEDLQKSGINQNFLFSGSAGTGKTSIAKLLVQNHDYIFLNGSLDRGIDILRNTIEDFLVSGSLNTDTPKIVLLDEADGLNVVTTQPALRGFIEEYSRHARFILTANHPNKLISPLRSRLTEVNFRLLTEDKKTIIKRLLDILKAEGVPVNKEAILQLVENHFPDVRSMINILQKYKNDLSQIPQNALGNIDLIEIIKSKDFETVLESMEQIKEVTPQETFQTLYKELPKAFKGDRLGKMLMIVAKYSYQSCFCISQEINLTGCFVELIEVIL
jgi:DNA polymerase III delta prime subunit